MATLVLTATPAEGQGEAVGPLLQAGQDLLVAGGGRPVKRLRVTDTVAGPTGTGLVLVMDFDSVEAINAVLASDEYQAGAPARAKVLSNVQMLITEDLG